ncbi:MAG: efflux RND transporter periplasmic adaptor subunit [Myxococcota bacterium]
MKRNKKPMIVAILGIVLVVAALGGVKAAQIGAMMQAGESFVPPALAVTTANAEQVSWRSELTAVGSVVAVQGVTVASETPGTVTTIAFESGDEVDEGEILIRLDTSVERAELASAIASAKLAELDLKRRENLPPEGAVSAADLDAAAAKATQATADVSNVKAVIAKKTIRAPFSGRLGIRQVDLGEVLQAGAPIVSLQSSDPVYVDFSLPQQALARVRRGDAVTVTTDAFPDKSWEGTIEVVDAEVSTNTRNFMVRAVVANPNDQLRTGMFVDVRVFEPETRDLVVIPASAVLFAPYGNSVYVAKEQETESGEAQHVVEQAFVRLGERRGDLVAVLSGLDAGDEVVSTGAFKLQNGMVVTVRNDLAPNAIADPRPPNE